MTSGRPRTGSARALLRGARLGAAAAALSTAACTAWRPVAPLDDDARAELAILSSRLAVERVAVVAVHEGDGKEAEDLEAAVRLAGARIVDRDPSLTVVTAGVVESYEHPWALVLTLGIVPTPGRGWRRSQWRLVAEDGRQIAADVEMAAPSWIGWLVPPIALLPGWRLTTGLDRVATGDERQDTPRGEVHSDARRERIALALARSVVRLRDAASTTVK